MNSYLSEILNFLTGNYSMLLLLLFIVVLFILYLQYIIRSEEEKLTMSKKYQVVSLVEYDAKVVSKNTIIQYVNRGIEYSVTYPYTENLIECYATLEFIDNKTRENNELYLSHISYSDYNKIEEGMIIPIKKVIYYKKKEQVTVFESDILENLPLYLDEWQINSQTIYKNNFYIFSIVGLLGFFIIVLIILGALLWMISK